MNWILKYFILITPSRSKISILLLSQSVAKNFIVKVLNGIILCKRFILDEATNYSIAHLLTWIPPVAMIEEYLVILLVLQVDCSRTSRLDITMSCNGTIGIVIPYNHNDI